jgi:hypothetical protein
MFCPECKAEYVQGIERCSDCDVPLVNEVPAPEPVPEVNLVELLRTPNIIELTVVKSLLESMGISYVVQGEEGMHLLPIGPSGFLNPESLGAVICVLQEDLDRAQEMLQSASRDPEPDDDSNGTTDERE